MRESMLYTLHSHGMDPKVKQPTHFEHVYTSKNKMVRIWKVNDVDPTSKAHPFGSYPPALTETLSKSVAFKQV